MTDQATNPNPGAIDAAPAPTGDNGYDARIAAVSAMLDEESPATAGEPTASDGAPPTPAASTPQSGSPAASDDPAKRAEERRARLAAAAEKMRNRVDDKARQTAQERMQADLAAAQKRAADAEAKALSALDRAILKDPIAALLEMEREGVPADKVAEAIRQRLTDPATVAARETRQAIDPELAAFKKQNAELAARIEAFEKREQERESRVQAEQDTKAFFGYVQQSAQRAPLAAKLLEQDPEEFIAIANIAGERNPDLDRDALLDAVEEALDTEVRGIAQKYGGLFQALQTNPSQQSKAPPPNPRAAAQANTVSNSLAQGRTAIVDEEKDWAALTLEERAARLVRSA